MITQVDKYDHDKTRKSKKLLHYSIMMIFLGFIPHVIKSSIFQKNTETLAIIEGR